MTWDFQTLEGSMWLIPSRWAFHWSESNGAALMCNLTMCLTIRSNAENASLSGPHLQVCHGSPGYLADQKDPEGCRAMEHPTMSGRRVYGKPSFSDKASNFFFHSSDRWYFLLPAYSWRVCRTCRLFSSSCTLLSGPLMLQIVFIMILLCIRHATCPRALHLPLFRLRWFHCWSHRWTPHLISDQHRSLQVAACHQKSHRHSPPQQRQPEHQIFHPHSHLHCSHHLNARHMTWDFEAISASQDLCLHSHLFEHV